MQKRLLVVGAVAGLVTGGAVFAAQAESGGTAEAGAERNTASANQSDDFETNKFGQTVGPELETGPGAPDLFEASTDGGKPGYIYTADLTPPEAPRDGSATEAQRVLREQPELDEGGYLRVPVFAFDGRTQIGEFTAARYTEAPPSE